MIVLRKLSGWIFGGVFFAAGILKLMDPIGASLVVSEYFKFAGLHFLIPLSWWCAELLSLAEAILGAAVMTSIRRRTTAMVSGAFMAFYTALTVILWICDPPMDCGCFGEAIHLTHAQSLLKNLALDLLWLVIFLPGKGGFPVAGKAQRLAFRFVLSCTLLFAVLFATSIPAVDYTPFAPGGEIYRPDDFLEGAPILSFRNLDNGEYADSLAVKGRVMAVSVFDPDKIDPHDFARIRDVAELSLERRCRFILLVSRVPQWQDDSVLSPSIYLADRKDLLTLNRSNGGATYLRDGMVVKKWAPRHYPDAEALDGLLAMDPTEAAMNAETLPALSVQGFLLIMLTLMVLL